ALIVAGAGVASSIHAPGGGRVGIINATTDAPFFIADAKGYFKEEGLHVDFVSFDAAAKIVPSLATRALGVASGAVSVALYNAVARGVEMKVVADKAHHDPRFGHAALLVRKDLVDSGRFKDFKDLQGLKVALSGVGTSDESVLNEALKRGGLQWGDSTVVYLGFQQHPAAFANGAIDASLTSEPALTGALKTGNAVLFARNGQFYPDQQSATVIYGVAFIKHKPDAARKFTRAYIRGARLFNDAVANGALAGPAAAEVLSILTRYSLIKDPDVYKATTPPAIDPDGELNVASMRKDWQFFKETRQIDGSVTVDQVVDGSFAEDAVVSLGPYLPMSRR